MTTGRAQLQRAYEFWCAKRDARDPLQWDEITPARQQMWIEIVEG